MKYRVKFTTGGARIVEVIAAHTAGTWHLVTNDQPPQTLEASSHEEAIRALYSSYLIQEIVALGKYTIQGTITLPKVSGTELAPGVFALAEPTYRPDLGPTSLVCLAEVYGQLALVELEISFTQLESSR